MVAIKSIIKEINDPNLKLYRGEGYLYFVYDNPEKNVYETESVYVNRLNELSLETWVSIGKEFVENISKEITS